ncbi:AAA family ATPase [Streptomyces sp. NPDC097704]|uniref:AAA family ATPase n=1 Tax=Streptomyces sp. NPDC097704 TaxID=3157101 RepID=UPI00332F5C00
MPDIFSQPAWTEESGLPYPGAEAVAEDIARNEEKAAIDAQAKVEKKKALARKKGLAEAEEAYMRKLTAVPASSIVEERLVWLWQNRIPIGEITLLVGRGGVGKSTLAMQLGAWVTVGDMKGEFYRTPRNILIVINEDSPKNVVVPRLRAVGADLDRVHFVGISMLGRTAKVFLPKGCVGLAKYAQNNNVAAIMLDPLSSNLDIKQGTGNEIRPIVETIRRMAETAGTMAGVQLEKWRALPDSPSEEQEVLRRRTYGVRLYAGTEIAAVAARQHHARDAVQHSAWCTQLEPRSVYGRQFWRSPLRPSTPNRRPRSCSRCRTQSPTLDRTVCRAAEDLQYEQIRKIEQSRC